jgi:hypothetical protein
VRLMWARPPAVAASGLHAEGEARSLRPALAADVPRTTLWITFVEAFDRDGYIVVRDALSQQQVYALNAGFDERIQDVSGAGTDKDKVRFYIGDRPSSEIADRHGNKYSGRRFWSQAYRDLVDNPVVLPILREILGDRSYCHAAPNMPENLGPQFRLDHDNGALANDHAFAPRRAP